MFISLVGLLMPALVFSGFMFPIENMPLPLRLISNVVPDPLVLPDRQQRHDQAPRAFAAIVKPTLILAGMTLVLLAIAWRTFKQRL